MEKITPNGLPSILGKELDRLPITGTPHLSANRVQEQGNDMNLKQNLLKIQELQAQVDWFVHA